MSSNIKINEFQKHFYNQLIKRASELEITTKDLQDYKDNQKKMSLRPFTKVSPQELYRAFKQANMVFLGDFHTFDQNTRNLERLLREVSKEKSSYIFCFEFIHYKYQKIIEYYLDGQITELEFLEEIDYKESWKFPWAHYRPFFNLAKERGFTIIGLNSDGTLAQRDTTAAKILAKYRTKYPELKMIVLFGELHIAPNKLPLLVEKELQSDIKHMIIHQNLDEVYWKMSLSSAQIIKFNNKEYSLQTSPPWIKYESMIYWYENLCEDPDFDIHEYEIEKGLKGLNSSVSDNFYLIAQKINNGLELGLEDDELTDFEIFDFRNLKKFSKEIKIDDLTFLIENSQLFKIPQKFKYYCPNYSINRITSLVGLHLRAKCNNGERPQYFIENIYDCAAAYFCSKILNPHKKCNHYQDIYELIKYQKGKSLQISQKTLSTLDDISKGRLSVGNLTKETQYFISKNIGKIIGELLFERYVDPRSQEQAELAKFLIFGPASKDGLDTILDLIDFYKLYKVCSKRPF